MTGVDNAKSRTAYTRDGRKQLFAVLQSARGSSGECFIQSGILDLSGNSSHLFLFENRFFQFISTDFLSTLGYLFSKLQNDLAYTLYSIAYSDFHFYVFYER